jgi:spore germination cell wall hydrolase CwlJ-like protein
MIAAVVLAAATGFVCLSGSAQVSAARAAEAPVTSLDKVMNKLKKKSKSYVSKLKKEIIDKKEEDAKDDKNKTEIEDSTPLTWNENFTEADLRLMSAIIYCEAADMSEEAGIAVGNVILNRMRDTKDWKHVNTIKEVVYDNKWCVQFTPAYGNPSSLEKALAIYDNLEDYEGKWQYRQMQKNITEAKKALSGVKVVPDSYMFFNGHIESSKKKCEEQGKSYIVIDHHIYF